MVEKGSCIVTDKWTPYSALANSGYMHFTVNHSKNYVNSEAGYHIQGIERVWLDARVMLKRMRQPSKNLQSHLNLLAWKKENHSHMAGLLGVFFKDAQ